MSEPTIQGMFDQLEAWGAASARVIVRDENDKPLRAVIVVDGADETQDVIDALDIVEAKWDEV